jgi:DNA-binding transcriptional ArsR family regulator
MVTMRFGGEDLGRVRFAVSPLFELWQSIRALQSPAAHPLHLPWLLNAKERIADLDLSLLYALQRPEGWNPDFIHPPPAGAQAAFEDELAQLLSTPPDRIRRDFAHACPPGLPDSLVDQFTKNPDGMLSALADVLRAYWQRAVAPEWDRVRAVLQGDILYRACQSAVGGAQALFADIDDGVRYAETQVAVDKPWDIQIELDGRGLALLPSAFICKVAVIYESPWQPTIIYPARGTALLWEPTRAAPEALAALLGNRRAAVLSSLDAPRSTTELAQLLGAPAGGVSRHLSVLRSAGLVSRHRVGRVVLYGRSDMGELLTNGRGHLNGG